MLFPITDVSIQNRLYPLSPLAFVHLFMSRSLFINYNVNNPVTPGGRKMAPIERHYEALDGVGRYGVWEVRIGVVQGKQRDAADRRGSLQRQQLSESATFITHTPFRNLLMNPLFISPNRLLIQREAQVFAFKSAEAFKRVKIHFIYLVSLFKHFLCYYLFRINRFE